MPMGGQQPLLEVILSGKNGHAKARTDMGTRSNDKGRTQDVWSPTKFGLFSINSGSGTTIYNRPECLLRYPTSPAPLPLPLRGLRLPQLRWGLYSQQATPQCSCHAHNPCSVNHLLPPPSVRPGHRTTTRCPAFPPSGPCPAP